MRPLALGVVCGVVLLCGACKSNNEGKIVGKWKAVSSTDANNQTETLPPGTDLFFEFTQDGRFLAYAMQGGTRHDVGSAKYSLGSGDWLTLTDLNPPQDGKTKSREKVGITGDTMTIQGEKGKTMTFTRVKG